MYEYEVLSVEILTYPSLKVLLSLIKIFPRFLTIEVYMTFMAAILLGV